MQWKSASFVFACQGGWTRAGVGSFGAVVSCLGGDGGRTPPVTLVACSPHAELPTLPASTKTCPTITIRGVLMWKLPLHCRCPPTAISPSSVLFLPENTSLITVEIITFSLFSFSLHCFLISYALFILVIRTSAEIACNAATARSCAPAQNRFLKLVLNENFTKRILLPF